MNNQRLYQVLKGPVFSEKAQVLGETQGVQVFRVCPRATKLEIKKAVEQLFGVEVASVNTLNVKGKTKRFGRTVGRRSDTKKPTSPSSPVRQSLLLSRPMRPKPLRNKDESHADRKM